MNSRAARCCLAILLSVLSVVSCSKTVGLHSYGSASSDASRQEDTLAVSGQGESTGSRKIVSTHSIHIEVTDFDHSFEALTAIAQRNGGYNTEVSQRKNYDQTKRARIAMKLPPKTIPETLKAVRNFGEVISEENKGDDVTEQYFDLDARLRNSKASEARLLELLKKGSGKVSDVIEVEKELTRVRGDIESMEARKRAMDRDTTMTTLVVELSEPHRAIPAGKKLWDPIRTSLGDALEILAFSVRYAILTVIALIPWIPLFALALYARRRYVARVRKPKTDA